MYSSLKPYIKPTLSFGLYAIQTTGSVVKGTSLYTVNHFVLNFMSREKSDIIHTAFYLLTRNIIPLVYEGLLSICAISSEDENPTMTIIKHTVIPTLLGIICGKCLTTESRENPLTWRHVIGMEILRGLEG